MATSDEWVAIRDVHAISNGLCLICEVRRVRYGVPERCIAPDSAVRRPGDRGVLRVSRQYAEEVGLVMTGD